MSNHTPFEQSIATARKGSPLRQRMIDDMMVRNFAPNTMVCYLKQVSYFARYFGRSPDRLGAEEIRSYQVYLAKERKVSVSSRTVAASALRFLYAVTLKQDRIIPNDSGSPEGTSVASDPEPGRSSSASPSRSLVFSPRDLQHDVWHRCARQRGPASACS